MRWIQLAVCAALLPNAVSGQTEKRAVGYRGGFSEPTSTVAAGVIEMDAGGSIVRAGDAETLQLGELTLHAGATSWLELRLHLNSYAWTEASAAESSGRQDPGVGAAARLSRNSGLRPDAVLIGHVTVPGGSLPARERSWRPTSKLSVGWALPARLYLASTVGVTHDSEAGESYGRAFGSAWLGRPISGRVNVFGEVFGFDRTSRDGESATHVRGGVALLLTDWLHMDIHGGHQLEGAGEARSFGVGFKTRW